MENSDRNLVSETAAVYAPPVVNQRYTWSDYCHWPDCERWELIAGQAFAMSPSPTTRHQRIVGKLFRAIAAALAGNPCEPFVSPLDVKLSETDIVQPDILVVCDPDQIKPTHVEGPPALVIEVISDASVIHDRLRKLQLYARSGIAEYWIVTPTPGIVEVLLLDGESFRVAGTYGQADTVQSPSLPTLAIPLAGIV